MLGIADTGARRGGDAAKDAHKTDVVPRMGTRYA